MNLARKVVSGLLYVVADLMQGLAHRIEPEPVETPSEPKKQVLQNWSEYEFEPAPPTWPEPAFKHGSKVASCTKCGNRSWLPLDGDSIACVKCGEVHKLPTSSD